MKLNKVAINNILQMGIIQLINYLFPIIMIPYLLRNIGVENYGKVSVVFAIAQLIIIVCDYGFNFTATQKIAVTGKIDHKLVTIIYSFKVIVLFASSILLLFYILFWKINNLYEIFFLFSFIIYAGSQSFIPLWLYRGINKIGYLSFFTVLTKILSLILMFLLVKKGDDYVYMGFVYAFPSFVIMLVSLWIIYKKFGVRLSRISFRDIVQELHEGKDMFLSNIIGTLYTTLNPVILSIFAGDFAVGVYSTCEKIVGVINSMTNAVSQAVYPIVCKKMEEKPFITIGSNIPVPVSFLYLGWWAFLVLVGCILFTNIDFIVPLLLKLVNGEGVSIAEQPLVLKLLIYSSFFITLGHLLGIQSLIPLNDKASVRKSITNGAIVNMLLGIVGSIYYGAVGMSFAILICECVVAITMFINLYKKHIKVHRVVNG